MSTFDGFLKEYPLISIDQFQHDNLSSTVFFLSHCHSDHMRGLSSKQFHETLAKRFHCKVFMSGVSKILLENDDIFVHLAQYLEAIPIEQPTTLIVPDEHGKEVTKVTVTLLPAGHCPGSVMFLFEGQNGTVLYTGDFRLEVGSTKRFKDLHYSDGSVKPIVNLYFDSTFCDPKSLYIPNRQDCLDATSALVEPWIHKGPNYIVYFICPASIGYEYIFINLYRKFGVKTHVKVFKFKKYQNIPEIRDAVTTSPNEARIHCCWEDNYAKTTVYEYGQAACGFYSPNNKPVYVRRIKLSAMFYTFNINVNDIVIHNERNQMFQACFSTHSSLTEIWDMVSYLQPKEIHANVIPEGKTEDEILKYVLPLLKNKEANQKAPTFSPLGKLVENARKEVPSISCDSLNFDYEICVTKKRPAAESLCNAGDRAFQGDIQLENDVTGAEDSDVTDSQKTTDSYHTDGDIFSESHESMWDAPEEVTFSKVTDTYSKNESSVPTWNYSSSSENEADEHHDDVKDDNLEKPMVFSINNSDVKWSYSPDVINVPEETDKADDKMGLNEESRDITNYNPDEIKSFQASVTDTESSNRKRAVTKENDLLNSTCSDNMDESGNHKSAPNNKCDAVIEVIKNIPVDMNKNSSLSNWGSSPLFEDDSQEVPEDVKEPVGESYNISNEKNNTRNETKPLNEGIHWSYSPYSDNEEINDNDEDNLREEVSYGRNTQLEKPRKTHEGLDDELSWNTFPFSQGHNAVERAEVSDDASSNSNAHNKTEIIVLPEKDKVNIDILNCSLSSFGDSSKDENCAALSKHGEKSSGKQFNRQVEGGSPSAVSSNLKLDTIKGISCSKAEDDIEHCGLSGNIVEIDIKGSQRIHSITNRAHLEFSLNRVDQTTIHSSVSENSSIEFNSPSLLPHAEFNALNYVDNIDNHSNSPTRGVLDKSSDDSFTESPSLINPLNTLQFASKEFLERNFTPKDDAIEITSDESKDVIPILTNVRYHRNSHFPSHKKRKLNNMEEDSDIEIITECSTSRRPEKEIPIIVLDSDSL